ESDLHLFLTRTNTVNEDGTRGGVPSFITLAHELRHGLTHARGTNDRSPSGLFDPDTRIPGILTAEEINARIFENRIRHEHRLKLRATPYTAEYFLHPRIMLTNGHLKGVDILID
ncbi:MAG: hypothetical protein AAFP82_04940, partial [Bacteroidota bacterium]